MNLAEVSAMHRTVEWHSDRDGGIIDNWAWWAERGDIDDSHRVGVSLLDLMEAIHDGMAVDDRIRLFCHGKSRWRALRKWMAVD